MYIQSSSEVDSEVAYEVFPGICFLVVVMLQSCCARLTLKTLTCRAGFDQTMTNVSYSSRLSISLFPENVSKGLGTTPSSL